MALRDRVVELRESPLATYDRTARRSRTCARSSWSRRRSQHLRKVIVQPPPRPRIGISPDGESSRAITTQNRLVVVGSVEIFRSLLELVMARGKHDFAVFTRVSFMIATVGIGQIKRGVGTLEDVKAAD